MADDAAGAVRRTPRPAPAENENLRVEIDEARTYVAQHNHLVNPAWTLRDVLVDFVERLKCERDSLLPRLADFAEAAGKERSTEWIRLCATLPPEEWPPAPAYKGPMVPAADLDLALWLYAEATYFRNWTLKAAELELASHGQAEDKLAAELDDIRQHARNVAAQRDVEHRAFVDAAAERDALRARLDAVRTVLNRPWPDDEDHHDFVNGQVEAARAALQGDQPTGEADRG